MDRRWHRLLHCRAFDERRGHWQALPVARYALVKLESAGIPDIHAQWYPEEREPTHHRSGGMCGRPLAAATHLQAFRCERTAILSLRAGFEGAHTTGRTIFRGQHALRSFWLGS